jgi:hypothetical protein
VGKCWVFEEGQRLGKRCEKDFLVSAGDQKACRSWNRGFKDVGRGRIATKGFEYALFAVV